MDNLINIWCVTSVNNFNNHTMTLQGMLKQFSRLIRQRKDIRWILFWFSGLLGLWLWDTVFLNPLAYELIRSAIVNTFAGASAAVALSLFIGWPVGIALYFLENGRARSVHLLFMFSSQSNPFYTSNRRAAHRLYHPYAVDYR